MNNQLKIVLLAIFLQLAFGSVAKAQSSDELMKEFKKIQSQMLNMQSQMQEYQNRIQELEQKLEETQDAKKQKVSTAVDEVDGAANAEEIVEIVDDPTLPGRFLDRLNLNLFTALKYEDFDNENPAFDADSVELFASANLTDRLKAYTELEFKQFVDEDDGSRDDKVSIRQAWVEYGINEYINPRLGVLLVPFGKYNQEHFPSMRDLTSRPIALQMIVPTVWAEAGAGFSGKAFIGDSTDGEFFRDSELNYSMYVMNGLKDQINEFGLREATGDFGLDNNNDKAVVGRLGFLLSDDFEVGVSGYFGQYGDTEGDAAGLNVDWDFGLGPLELIGEFVYFDFSDAGFNMVPEKMHGAYAQANYHFWFDALNNTFLGRDFDAPTFTGVVRWGRASIDAIDFGELDNIEERLTFGLNYRPVETFVFKAEYQLNDTDNDPLVRGNSDGFLASIAASF